MAETDPILERHAWSESASNVGIHPGAPTLEGRLPWRGAYPGGAPTLEGRLPWRGAYPGGAPTLEGRLPWRGAYPGGAPTLEGRLPWRGAYPGGAAGAYTDMNLIENIVVTHRTEI